MTYTLIYGSRGILRDSDNVPITCDPTDPDWQEYLSWLAKGNTPNPAIQPSPVIYILKFEDFLSLFTEQELTGILNSTNLKVKIWLLKISGAQMVRNDDSTLPTDLENLVDINVITSQRKTEILNPTTWEFKLKSLQESNSTISEPLNQNNIAPPPL